MKNITVFILVALILGIIPSSFQLPRMKNDVDSLANNDVNAWGVEQPESENLSAEKRDDRSTDDFEEDDWTDAGMTIGKKAGGQPKKYVTLNKSNLFENNVGKMDMRLRREKDSGIVIVDFCYRSAVKNPAEAMRVLHNLLNRAQHD